MSFFAHGFAPPAEDAPVSLRTVAETSDFRATASHAQVVELLDRLAAVSPLARRSELGKSGEGRAIPLLLIADPPVESAADARQQIDTDGKLLVLMIGNIHAGEVDGKEALPMLARELLSTPQHPLLKHLILAFAPIYNCDGNERVSKTNRPGQIGPEEGMGQRENAAGLDLNRDFVKLEAPETRALVRFMNEWDPHIFVDTHTTNGSHHRYVVTYEGPKSPTGDRELIRYCRDEMMPAITRSLLSKHNVPTFVYGDFNRDNTRWETYPGQPRYGTTYFGLRNRISVLSEGYSYASYRTRVLGTLHFVRSILEFAAENRAEIVRLLAAADQRAAQPARHAEVALASRAVPRAKKVTAAGFVEEQRDGRTVATDTPRDYEVELWTEFEPALSVERPSAYVLPARLTRSIDLLRLHGIRMQRLAKTCDCEVQSYIIEKVAFANDPFQGHRIPRVDVRRETRKETLEAGAVVVFTSQPLGNLAAFLLEPQSDDGLATWNLLDEDLKVDAAFPILRIMDDGPLRAAAAPLGQAEPRP